MRRTLLLPAFLCASVLSAQTILVMEDFEGHTSGAPLAQTLGAPWTTWSNAPGTVEDATISDEQAVSGSLSGKWVSTVNGGGPTDIVIPLGDQTTGAWVVAFNMFIPSGKGGYFNVLHHFNGGNSVWAVEVTLPPNGNIMVGLQGQNTAMGTFPFDTWFPVMLAIDLDNDGALLMMNEVLIHNWPFSWTAGSTTPSTAQLGGLNFFAYAGGASQTTYYIDDLMVLGGTATDVAELATTGIAVFPNPVTDALSVTLDRPAHQVLWQLSDATGRTVRNGQWAGTAGREVLDMSGLPGGVYSLAVTADGRRHVQRVVKH